jgi:hypothetical protein
LILGDKTEPVKTISHFRQEEETLLGLISITEPTSIDVALQDPEWILTMQEELNQFTRK